MAFWSDNNNREPVRSNRWTIEFGAATDGGVGSAQDIDNYTFALKECDRPSFEINTVEHLHLSGHYIKFPGNLKWKPINMKFATVQDRKPKPLINNAEIRKNWEGGSLLGVLQNVMGSSGYQNPITGSGISQIKKYSSSLSNGFISLYSLDPDGQQIEAWDIYNPFISSINYGRFSYSSDDIVEVSLVIQYDWARQRDIPITSVL